MRRGRRKLIEHAGQRRIAAQAGGEDGEFVTAEAGDDVVLAHVATQEARYLLQHAVTLGVTEAVVDLLEIIYVDEEEAAALLALLADERLLDANHCRVTVEYAREAIELGHPA